MQKIAAKPPCKNKIEKINNEKNQVFSNDYSSDIISCFV